MADQLPEAPNRVPTREEIEAALKDIPESEQPAFLEQVSRRMAVAQGVANATSGALARNAQASDLSPTQQLARARMAQAPNVPGAAVPATAAILTAGMAPEVMAGAKAAGSAIGQWGLANPELAGAIARGGPRLLKGDIKGAAGGALEGFLEGAGVRGLGKLLPFLARMGSAAPAAGAVAEAAPAARAAAAGLTEKQAAKTFAPGNESMAEIADKIVSWRKDMGLSAGQIADSLREHYKVPLAIGKKMAQQVIDSLE